jgi:hypothetical protein
MRLVGFRRRDQLAWMARAFSRPEPAHRGGAAVGIGSALRFLDLFAVAAAMLLCTIVVLNELGPNHVYVCSATEIAHAGSGRSSIRGDPSCASVKTAHRLR